MNQPTTAMINEFAKAFAQKGRGKGLTKDEILKWFRRYSNNVVDPDFYGQPLTKEKTFHFCIERLHVEDQYRALLDLCLDPPRSINSLPDESRRVALLSTLFSSGAPNGLATGASQLTSWDVQREWLKVISRIEKKPDAAVTSARTIVEKVCKLILAGDGSQQSGLREGDLGKLVKATRKCLGLPDGPDQMVAGMASLLSAIAGMSNAVGDRHGTLSPCRVTLTEARLVANVSFALSLYLLELRRDRCFTTKPSMPSKGQDE